MAGDSTQAASEKVRKLRADLLIKVLQFAQIESSPARTAGLSNADEDERPVSARQLAAELCIVGNAEVVKRRIREAVEYAREHGHMVCANGEGYWLARDAAEYTAYEETRTARTKFEFVRRKKRRKAVSERNTGQQVLFGVESKGSDAWAKA